MKFDDLKIYTKGSFTATLLSFTDGVAKLQLVKNVVATTTVSGDTSQLAEMVGKKITIADTGDGRQSVSIATEADDPIRGGEGCATGERNVRND